MPGRFRVGPYLYLAPALLVLVVFIYWPIGYSFWLSLHDWDFLRTVRPFVGFENYADLLGDDDFTNALWVTCVFTLASVPLRLVLALALAHLLVRETPAIHVLRTVYFMPVVASSVSVAVVWSWLYNTDLGLINQTIRLFGGTGLSWIFDTDTALMAVVIVNIWKQLGYDTVIYVAGLQAIPATYYEAARIDGARPLQQFVTITVPLVMPTTFFLLVISVIDSFQVFTLVNVMTQGGPALSTDVLINLFYRLSFIFFDIGRGSALAVLLFLLLLVLTVLKFGVLGRRVNYDLY